MPPVYKGATHEEYVKLSALVEAGHTLHESAKIIGLPLSAFKRQNADPEWFAQIAERAETVRAGLIDEQIDNLASKSDPSPQIVLARAKAYHPAYREKQQIEISGTVQHEQKVVSLGDILDLADELGIERSQLGTRSRAALPGAQELLPAPADRQAGAVPAARES